MSWREAADFHASSYWPQEAKRPSSQLHTGNFSAEKSECVHDATDKIPMYYHTNDMVANSSGEIRHVELAQYMSGGSGRKSHAVYS